MSNKEKGFRYLIDPILIDQELKEKIIIAHERELQAVKDENNKTYEGQLRTNQYLRKTIKKYRHLLGVAICIGKRRKDKLVKMEEIARWGMATISRCAFVNNWEKLAITSDDKFKEINQIMEE